MLSSEEFLQWCGRLSLSQEARQVVERGYVERLAAAHAVSAGSLIGRELFGRPGGTKPLNVGLVSYAINGVAGGAKRWVQALETVTSRPDLRYLTLLPFERLFARPFLFRPVRAWCPPCCQMMATLGGPVCGIEEDARGGD